MNNFIIFSLIFWTTSAHSLSQIRYKTRKEPEEHGCKKKKLQPKPNSGYIKNPVLLLRGM